jgi:hypothetical protein
LEKLRSRKSELLSHLQNECSVPGLSPGALMGRSQLDQVLSTRPLLTADPLSSSINNTFVAVRATNTLEDFGELSGLGS